MWSITAPMSLRGCRLYWLQKQEPAIFRLDAHIDRLYDSAKVYRMDIPYTKSQFRDAVVKVVKVNKLKSCYIRPFAFRGYRGHGTLSLEESSPMRDRGMELGILFGARVLGKGDFRSHFLLATPGAQYLSNPCESGRELPQFPVDEDGSCTGFL